MGDAKRKNRATLDTLLQDQPMCVYCGGDTPATTIDHMPPIGIFDQRLRPKGLEFSACADCNGGSRAAEQVAAFVSRMLPDAQNPALDDERRRVMRQMANNHPAIIRELMPSPSAIEEFKRKYGNTISGHPLSANGPLLNAA